MFLKKTTCLLLTLVFMCTVAVPALAGGDPPGVGGGNIHPWDNNDDVRPNGGPKLSARQPLIFGYGFNGRLVTLPVWSVAGVVKAQRSSNAKANPQSSGSLQVLTRNR